MQVLFFLGIFDSGFYVNDEEPASVSGAAVALGAAVGLVGAFLGGPFGAGIGAKIGAGIAGALAGGAMVNIFNNFVIYILSEPFIQSVDCRRVKVNGNNRNGRQWGSGQFCRISW